MNCNFSKEHYIECLQLAKDKGYTIVPVNVYSGADEWIEKYILMRHDIDFSLEYAYELANFEYDLGIKSSYYIYLHSELYNALSPKSMGMIREMKEMGHEIGLHYDSRYDLKPYKLGGNLQTECDILLGITDNRIDSFTQHLPGISNKPDYDSYGGLILNPNDLPVKFISDSGRNWREGCMCKHIGKIDKLHILVHPEWWVSGGITREDAVHKLWQSNLQTLVRNMTDIKQMLVDYVRDDLKQ